MTAKWLGVGLLTVTGLGAGASYVVYKQDQEALPIREGKLPPVGGAEGQEGKCPVDHSNMVKESSCPMADHEVKALQQDNQMPPPNQRPHPDQNKPLPTHRIRSSIPRGTTPEPEKERWEYPSEQMFYNALRRKGWQGVQEEDVSAIVAIHNTTNERCWAEILRWEVGLHAKELEQPPRLEKFQGKYRELSPKARMKMFFQGVKRPFDRHDWMVHRNGRSVRYVIDFYDGQANGAAVSMHLDVRPALDSVGAVWDRARMFLGFVPTLDEVYEEYPHLSNRMQHE